MLEFRSEATNKPMALDELELTAAIPATPDAVFGAWMRSKGHAAFTGAAARIEPRVGTHHHAWDGYIHGWVLAVEPGKRVKLSWRTTDFAPSDFDSVVELSFERAKDGCRLKLVHSNIPEGEGERYRAGWNEFYFEPIAKHFATKASKKPVAKAVAKKPVAKKRSK